MYQKVTDVMTKASPNGEEARNKDEPQKDKLKKPKRVEAVTNEVTTRATKSNVMGEKIYMDALASCDIFRCGYIVCIYLT